MRGEFDLIAYYFAPLAAGAPGAFGLGDDAAVLEPSASAARVLTLDTLVAGVHYREVDPADTVACKALRVNLSDLAAMGARPAGYLLSLSLNEGAEEAWLAAFARGLEGDQSRYGMHLFGGDTTRTPGPTTISVTAIGELPPGTALRRSGAAVGDRVYVSGRIGDSALGLAVLEGRTGDVAAEDATLLGDRYRLPQPRVALGARLRESGIATAAIDVSDGLLADLDHLAKQSGVGVRIDLQRIPMSSAAQRLVERDTQTLMTALCGGDDYELAFTAPADAAGAVAALASELDLPLTCIGEVTADEGVRLLDPEGVDLPVHRSGWTHF
jgi:thiamine-monophosphate kinase